MAEHTHDLNSIYAMYARLSDEEQRSKVDDGILESIRDEMQGHIDYCESMGIVYMGPPAVKVTNRSIPNQIQDMFDWLEKRSHKCYAVVVDYDFSGWDEQKKGLNQIDRWIMSATIGGVLFKDSKRFGRNVKYTEDLFQRWRDEGAEAHVVYDDETFQDDFLRPLDAVLNQKQVTDGRKYFKQGLLRHMHKKKPRFDPPWGYKWDRRKENWIKDRKVSDQVVQFFTDFALKTHYRTMMQTYKISHPTISNRIKRAYSYAGFCAYVPDKSKKKKSRYDVVAYEGSHEPYFPEYIAEKIIKAFNVLSRTKEVTVRVVRAKKREE